MGFITQSINPVISLGEGGHAQDVGGLMVSEPDVGGVLTHVWLAGEISTKHATILLQLG